MEGAWFHRRAAALAVASIRLYQFALSPLFAGSCRFEPSCSRYAEDAICTHGLMRGTLLGARRLWRCRPFGGSGYDPVPRKC